MRVWVWKGRTEAEMRARSMSHTWDTRVNSVEGYVGVNGVESVGSKAGARRERLLNVGVEGR